MFYAIGQGALGVECRESDWKIRSLLEPLYDVETTLRCVCERSFLKTLGGGCSAPVAVSSSLKKGELTITGAVWSLDGQTLITDICKGKMYLPKDDGEPLRWVKKNPQIQVDYTRRYIDVSLSMYISERFADFTNFYNNFTRFPCYDRKCPYQEPRLYCGIVPGKMSALSLFGAEELGKDLAKRLIEKNAVDVMLEARDTISNSK